MSVFSSSVILEGRATPSPSPIRLFAGPLTMLLEPDSGFIRQIRAGTTMVLNGVYAAVRDENWNTVLPEIRDLKINQLPSSFAVQFEAICIAEDIHFVWEGAITGDANGRIEYRFQGQALSEFLKNRIGFCVLHDASCSGSECIILHTDGTATGSTFPSRISPHQPFKSIRAITHKPHGVGPVTVRMEGDDFEMEDQRNWTDASYKTYCTPLDLPRPVELRPGDSIRQRVIIDLSTKPPAGNRSDRTDVVHIMVDGDTFHQMPAIGLGMPSHGIPPSERDAGRLAALKLNHLRCDVRMWEDTWQRDIQKAADLAARLSVRLHIAVFLSGNEEEQLRTVAKSCLNAPVDAWLIFHQDEMVTDARWTELARNILTESRGMIVGGTDAYFTALNRERPANGSADAMCWSLNPQVHAFDNLSLVETLGTQWETARSAAALFNAELMISPITLRPRWNPDAIDAPPPVPIDQLPPEVDQRQMSLFGAAWTLGSIASLSWQPLLRSVTYYETTGWRGLMETSAGPQLAHLFVSRPCMVFPMYFVFALISGHGHVRPVRTSDRLKSAALLCSADPGSGDVRLLVASYHQQEIRVELPKNYRPVRQLVLDRTVAVNSCRAPEEFLKNGWKDSSETVLKLGPFSLVCVDGQLVESATANDSLH